MLKRLLNFEARSAKKLVIQLEKSTDHEQAEILKSLAKGKNVAPLEQPLKQAVIDILNSSTSNDVKLSAIPLVDEVAILEARLADDITAEASALKIIELIKSDRSNPLWTSPAVLDVRINQASADEVEGLLEHATSIDEICRLALRSNEDTMTKILSKKEMRCEPALVQLEKCSRGRDKTTNRLARSQLEIIKNAKASKAEKIASLSDIDETIKKTLKTTATNLDALIVQRKKLNLLNEKRKQYIAIVAESELKINELVDGEATFTAQDSLLANLDISIPDATSNPYPALIKRLELLQQNITLDNAMKYLAQLSAEKSAIAQSWAEASEQFPPNRNQANIFQLTNTMTKQFTDAAQRLSQVPAKALIPFATPTDKNLKRALELNKQWLRSAEKTLSGVAWPAQLKQPLVLETLSNSIATCAARSIEINGEYAKLSAELKDLVKSIQRSAESGSLKLASQGLSRARNIQKLGISGLEKEINSLSAQVGEMRDWQDFATHPKRDQLILDLEKLVQKSLEPLDQADKLKELRGQWNALGILRKEESELQKRFDDLAEQAYGVCTLYYAAQDTIKSDNLARRKKLCTDIEAYISATDWANADLQAVENIMRAARSEWRTYHPCENKFLKPIEKAFETAQAKLYKFIKEGKGKNVAAKEAIVSDAKALLELKDLTTQTAQAKALQARWKSIGTTPRGIDQRLWREFRKICDEIFKRLGDSQNAEATATKAKQQILTSAIEAFNAKESDIAAFKTNFETLATLADATKLTNGQVNQLRELRKTMHDLQLASKHSRVRSKLQQWSDWDAAVSKAEQNSETIESPHNIFANRIAGIYPDEDLERLTVEAEIAADISSPDKYRSLRMSLQVALMNAGRRNMQLVDNKEFIDRWCSAGPKLIKHNTLRQRFFKALEHRLS